MSSSKTYFDAAYIQNPFNETIVESDEAGKIKVYATDIPYRQ